MSLDKEIARKWADALRSGKYVQTQGKLRRAESFCCLGVLCDITPDGEWDRDAFLYKRSMGYGCLPTELMAETGVDQIVHERLVEANDTGKSFTQIASMIEEMAGLASPENPPTHTENGGVLESNG